MSESNLGPHNLRFSKSQTDGILRIQVVSRTSISTRFWHPMKIVDNVDGSLPRLRLLSLEFDE
ncbi:hypothetical protein COLO4_22325 [Corchorus olitorius]|uniref:Uncharacterized protein n=1 Tax=Corchorus olitorius TaxID=93759 RepID=A0A1R3IMY3_9ROSI|nr:hypothetical protein COLO4_22325 [Corchorus olitorius]